MQKKSKLLLLLKYDIKNLLSNIKHHYLIVFICAIIISIYNSFEDVYFLSNFIHLTEQEASELYSDNKISFLVENIFIMFSILVSSIIINTPIIIIKEYGRTLFGKEGYLIHTLPVSSDQILLSKIISSIIFFVISLCMVSLFLYISLFNYGASVQIMPNSISVEGVFITINALCYLIIIFCSIAMAHNTQKNAILAIINTTLLISLLNLILYILDIILLEIFSISMNYDTRTIFSSIMTIIFGIASYFKTKKIIENNLNLI